MNTKQQRNATYRNELLSKPTDAELVFKARLDKVGIKYMFQKGFIKGDYHCIVDFYLPKPYKLCIEIDGGYHDTEKQKKRDLEKDNYLRSRGFKVLHIRNEDVETFNMSF